MKRLQMICSAWVIFCGMFAQAQVTGSGTTNYVPLWTGSSALGNSKLYQNGTNIGVGTTTPQWALDVNGHVNSGQGYLIGEALVLATPGGTTDLAEGYGAMPNNTGTHNTATGADALEANTSGEDNSAHGYDALGANTTGIDNSAYGSWALYNNTTGSYNTAVGASALASTTGSQNTAVGDGALNKGTTGSGNIALGYYAGIDVDTGSDNIDIGNTGATADSAIIRIGTSGNQSSFFAAGIRGVTTGENNAVPVLIDSNGQLGTVSSSRRFKTDIQDMGDASRDLMRLRPVTYRYKKPFSDGSRPIQYGLIAEEVADVYPDLVAHSSDGQIETVKYQVLDVMLLNEVQRLQAQIEAQQEESKAQEAENKLQRAQIEQLTRQVREVQAALKASGQATPEVRTVNADVSVIQQ